MLSSFPSTVYWRSYPFSDVYLWHLCQEACGFISAISSLFPYSMYWFVCQDCAVLVMTALHYVLRTGIVLSTTFYFCFWLFWPFGIICAFVWSLALFGSLGKKSMILWWQYDKCIDYCEWYEYFNNADFSITQVWKVSMVCMCIYTHVFHFLSSGFCNIYVEISYLAA